MAEPGDGSQQGPREGSRSQAMSEQGGGARSSAREAGGPHDTLNLSQPAANVFQTFPTLPRASSKSRSPRSDAEAPSGAVDGARRADPSFSEADDVFPNPYFPVRKASSTPRPSRNSSIVAAMGDLALGPPSATSPIAENGSSSTLPPPVSLAESSGPRPPTSAAVFPTKEKRRGSQSSNSRSARAEPPQWDAPRRRGSEDSIGMVMGSRRESEVSVSTISAARSPSSDKSASPPLPSEPRKGPVFPINKNAKFQSIQPVRTSRYKPPPESAGSNSPPSSIASSQHSASSPPPKQRAPRPPPIVTTSTSSTISSSFSNSTSDSNGSLKSSSASIRSSVAPSFRSSAPSTQTTSTRLSDGPQSIFANPEHKTRPITDLVSLPRFFKKKPKAPAAPPGRVGGSASILDAALSTSQTWSNPGRAPPTGQRGSFGCSSSSVNSDALAAAMARNPRRMSVMSDVSSLAPSEMGGAGGEGYKDGGGGLRTDVFATKPRPKAPTEPLQTAQVQWLGLQM